MGMANYCWGNVSYLDTCWCYIQEGNKATCWWNIVQHYIVLLSFDKNKIHSYLYVEKYSVCAKKISWCVYTLHWPTVCMYMYVLYVWDQCKCESRSQFFFIFQFIVQPCQTDNQVVWGPRGEERFGSGSVVNADTQHKSLEDVFLYIALKFFLLFFCDCRWDLSENDAQGWTMTKM